MVDNVRLDSFVGLPWADRGRTREGCDCWGLVHLAYAARGIALPSYSGAYSGVADKAAITDLFATERAPWASVEAGSEQPWDIVLLHERPWHVGIVVGDGLMLHMPRERLSLIEPYTARNFARRIEGFYRYGATA